MAAEFNWHKLPEEMRLGASPSDLITLYRGFAPHQIDLDRGMLSSAEASGDTVTIQQAIQAVEDGNIGALIHIVGSHAYNHHGAITPFVSATPELEIAERYARHEGEKVAELRVPANRLTLVPLMRYEALVLGAISLDQIVRVTIPKPRVRFREPAPTAIP